MTSAEAVLRSPFSPETLRRAWFAILSGVCLSPLILGTAINASLQIPVITFVAIALYVVGFLVLDGGRLERWRTSSLLRVPVSALPRRRIGHQLGYLLVDIPLGSLSIAIVLAWAAISIRNVLFYPVFGWTGYPDPRGAARPRSARWRCTWQRGSRRSSAVPG